MPPNAWKAREGVGRKEIEQHTPDCTIPCDARVMSPPSFLQVEVPQHDRASALRTAIAGVDTALLSAAQAGDVTAVAIR